MVSFMISNKTTKPGASDENLVDEVHMEQWKENKAYSEWWGSTGACGSPCFASHFRVKEQVSKLVFSAP